MNGGYGPSVQGSADALSVVESLMSEQHCGKYTGLTWEADFGSVRATGTPGSRAQFDEWCRDLRVPMDSVTFRGECATARGHRFDVPIHLVASKPWEWWNK